MSGLLARRAKKAAGGWAPTDISGCKLWLDADDLSTFTYSSGVVVSQWDDKSGDGQHVSQSTDNRRPSRNGTAINGITTVNFDGVSSSVGDLLSKTSFTTVSQPFTVAVVAVRASTSSTSQNLFRSGSGGVMYAVRFGSRALYSGSSPNITTEWGTTEAHTWVVGFDGSSTTSHWDGVADTVTTPGTLGLSGTVDIAGISHGADSWGGGIGEVIVYDSRISGADLTDLHDYLSNKWSTF